MAKIFHDCITVDHDKLLALCEGILKAHQVPGPDANYVAWHLVETNLRGTDSHGVARLPHYVRRLKGGSILPKPDMRFDKRAPALGLLDGGHGLGHLVMRRATEEAARLAGTSGAGWVAVNNSSHCGALAPFGLQLAQHGMIGIVFTHVDPMVLPHGSREPFCGTNPICVTAPGADGRTLCLDMASSVVPWNLVANAQNEKTAIPLGWAVDKDGNDTTNANDVRALYPFGLHKGSGLGIMIDVFSAMLGEAPYGPNIPKMYGNNMGEHRRLGGLVGAINIKPFVGLADFEQRISEMVSHLCGLPPMKGFDRVRFPGEPELESKRLREKEGIPVGINTLDDLNELALSVGLSPLKSNQGEH
jgi:ureidoglycolate dehydrogenase (NAD+)